MSLLTEMRIPMIFLFHDKKHPAEPVATAEPPDGNPTPLAAEKVFRSSD